MEKSMEVALSLLNLSAAAFFSSDTTALDQIEWKLSSRHFQGLAVSAPREIHVKQRDSLPFVLASQFTVLRDWETPLSDNLALILFDHGTAEVAVAKPFEEQTGNRPDLGRPSVRPPKPTGDGATGVATSVRRVDVRKLFSLDWRTRKLSLVALSFDVVSNEADVSLVGGTESTLVVPREITTPAEVGGTGLPSYYPTVGGVKPVTDGVAFTIDTTLPSINCVVRGSLATIAQARYLVHTGVAQGTTSAEFKQVAAVIPITFILVGRDWRVPWTFDWGIPVYADNAIATGTPLSATFAIPLPKERLSMLTGGEYAAYIILEGRIYGPQVFTMPILKK